MYGNPLPVSSTQMVFVSSTDMYGSPQPEVSKQSYQSTEARDMYGNPLPVPQQACYGSTSSVGQPSNPNTVRLDTSNFSKVSVEVAKDHMKLLNTLVSAYCGLIAGQIGNINLTHEDYQQIDKEEMDMMDIKWAFASAVRRAKDFMERTGRTSLERKKDSKYRFDKQSVKCFNYGERGHFKRECTKPAQHGNQNPFRNQGNQGNEQNQNQNRNNERTLMPVNNPNQAGASNANQALVVQVDEGCDWSIQLGSDVQDGTTCFVAVVKDLKHTSGGESSASGGESSEDEDSSGNDRRSILVDKAAYSSLSIHSAFMANVGGSSNINLTHEDYQQIDKEEMDMMDIKWAFASAVRRAKDFMERTGRTSLERKIASMDSINNQSSASIMVNEVTSRENVQSQLNMGTRIRSGIKAIKATSKIRIKTGITSVR
ncbi:putative transcription factor interactor and regulator CCHC(Zn) family [Helianthus annuus]|uniref:Transcription factor interactor and regulator CCHC(Zn) family n=1 Tax=Helianthus annuus TaxID=4232 RepID=A0A9K3NQA0_HELAN|nr:putative transcription factor interactor and regulator CCHC(Zn) family [Helianthus annuus]KAJ0595712.1 putative transcription factor interactor and regulator CCHC(Zn) family [Helianthus annuus]KAJ0756361.1 putative transcription factor interactor and regulator CCHC(Zn) family [Helianthus annuus]KAJ0760127.1 putative transcription factor interactor and regulator CCHC(Zn) family [Helianthus annuus]KAJ0925326.1 putative transcription factor interactor and regulator CCHC(Zn) family [Helianthus a